MLYIHFAVWITLSTDWLIHPPDDAIANCRSGRSTDQDKAQVAMLKCSGEGDAAANLAHSAWEFRGGSLQAHVAPYKTRIRDGRRKR